MGNSLVSVVIPVYKVEKLLDRCLQSVVSQTYRNLEILLVEDGSPDGCPALCDSWARRDSRIRVIHKQNAGLGLARNTGLDHATGDYVFFFDSDDYVSPDIVEVCVASAETCDSDMVAYGMSCMDAQGNLIREEVPDTTRDFYQGEEILSYLLPGMIGLDPVTGKKNFLNMSASGRMFAMKPIRESGWRFVSEREYISEDYYSILDFCRYVRRASVVPRALYFYCYNGSSLTHAFQPDRYGKICRCHEAMKVLSRSNGYPAAILTCLDSQFVGSVIGALKLIVTASDPFPKRFREVRAVVRDPYFQTVVRTMGLQNENRQRKVFLFAVRHRLSRLAWTLVRMKS